MSSLQRTIDGDVQLHRLKRDAETIDQDLLKRHGRSARTLVKDGPLRLTLMALAAGGAMPSHRADGPVTVHLLEGEVVFDAGGREHPLAPGDVLVLGSSVPHGARSREGCLFLLTVVHLPSPGTPLAASS